MMNFSATMGSMLEYKVWDHVIPVRWLWTCWSPSVPCCRPKRSINLVMIWFFNERGTFLFVSLFQLSPFFLALTHIFTSIYFLHSCYDINFSSTVIFYLQSMELWKNATCNKNTEVLPGAVIMVSKTLHPGLDYNKPVPHGTLSTHSYAIINPR
jgi:hypothetical protein